MCYSPSDYLHIFCCCFCYWVLVVLYCDQVECRGLFLFSYICLGLFWALKYDLFWRMSYGLLIVLLLEEVFCIQQLGPFDLWCHLVLGFLCWFFAWMTYLLVIEEYYCLTTTTVLESICALKFFSVRLMKLGTLTLGAYRLIIVIFFWCISPLVSMKCPSLSHKFEVYFVWFKYCYSYLFSGVLINLLPASHPKPVFISVNKMGLLLTKDCWIFLFNTVCQIMSSDRIVESIDIQC
jgi:hypothetical protein